MAACGSGLGELTLPSALALVLFALGVAQWQGLAQSGAVRGLKLAAVAIVAQAVWGMARTLCPDLPRAALAVVCAALVLLVLLVLLVPGTVGQVTAIVIGAVVGRWALQEVRATAANSKPQPPSPVGRANGAMLLSLFVVLLLALPLGAAASGSMLMQAVALAVV